MQCRLNVLVGGKNGLNLQCWQCALTDICIVPILIDEHDIY